MEPRVFGMGVRLRQALAASALVVMAAPALVAADGAVAGAAVPGPLALSASYHSCSLTTAGGVKCWGFNDAGQLGDGTTTNRSTPVDVPGLTSGVVAVSNGQRHSCVLTTAGGVKCWGQNDGGQLGDGSSIDKVTPVDVSGLTAGVVAITTGFEHSCALTTTGGMKCWGRNSFGGLGDGTTTNRVTPVNVSGLTSGVARIDGGFAHSCAVTTAGGAKCWGYNQFGQLGDGTKSNRLTPVNVSGLTSGVARIDGAHDHTCAVTTTGGAKCWGANGGRLGDGTTATRLTPVNVSGLTSGVAGLATGEFTTCAVTTGGGAKCWGNNEFGKLGDGTTVTRLTPVDVSGLTAGIAGVATGSNHTCAVTTAGGVKCWGHNLNGELGDGTTTNRLTPVDVSGSFYRVECPTLVAAPHTGFILSDGYATGSVATFSAESFYYLVGSATLHCQVDGTWDGPVPTAVPVPTVQPGTASAPEGQVGTTSLQVPVTLSAPSQQTVTVQWRTLVGSGTFADQADPATDYNAANGTVTFTPGQTTAAVTIVVNGDTQIEADEFVLVSFIRPTNARLGGFYGLGAGTIVNDD